MSNKSVGDRAESVAEKYLLGKGYEILDRNWRTRWCEIDIVARQNRRIYFVEVKSRKVQAQGSGLDYITAKKLTQMTFAAEIWISDHNWVGEFQLSVISIDGNSLTFIENIE